MLIEIVPHNPGWALGFARVKADLRPCLPPRSQIHHIGSTAVPGLAAKDIIDVQVSVPDLDRFDDTALTSAGFRRRPPTTDHCPPGMSLPKVDLQKRLYRGDTPLRANVHLRETGRFNQRYPLLCRDYLHGHPLASAAYATIKHRLATHFPSNPDAYYDIKDPVFDLIMAAAEAWATASGWTIPPSD